MEQQRWVGFDTWAQAFDGPEVSRVDNGRGRRTTRRNPVYDGVVPAEILAAAGELAAQRPTSRGAWRNGPRT